MFLHIQRKDLDGWTLNINYIIKPIIKRDTLYFNNLRYILEFSF